MSNTTTYTQEQIDEMKSLSLKHDIVRKLAAGFIFQALRHGTGDITPQVIEDGLTQLANNSDKIEEALLVQAEMHKRQQQKQ